MAPLELFCSADDVIESGFFDWFDYRLFFFSRKNEEKSPFNEDVVFAQEAKNNFIFGVCDGVGGAPKGREAAQIAATGLIEALKEKDISHGFFLNVLEKINKKILALKVGAGTTLCLGVLIQDEIRFFSIGDSEVYYTNNRGGLLYSNIAHSPVSYGVEAGLIGQEESLDDPSRNIVSNLLGDDILRFEVSSRIQMKKGHSILLGSDGLFDNFSRKKILSIISSGSFDESASQLSSLYSSSDLEDWRKDDDISFFYMRRIRLS